MREVSSNVVDVCEPVVTTVEGRFALLDVGDIVTVGSDPDELGFCFVHPGAFHFDAGFGHYRDELFEGLEPAVEHSSVDCVRAKVGDGHLFINSRSECGVAAL